MAAAGLTVAVCCLQKRRTNKEVHRIRLGQARSPAPEAPSPPLQEYGTLELLGHDVPGNAWELASRGFRKEFEQLHVALQGSPLEDAAKKLREVLRMEDPRPLQRPPDALGELRLDVAEVAKRELARGIPESSPVVKGMFFLLSWTLDRLYEGRPIQKFWVLETVARIPYFSYITVLHLYESLGWWRTPQIRHIHCAEEDNELHHLLIMEALGGNAEWADRFAAQHAAIAYYWVVVLLFMVGPQLAYNFSLLVEEHAFVTYSEFVDANKEVLRRLPPPPVAVQYYVEGDLYYFDKFQTAQPDGELPAKRRPPCKNLLDVFTNIRDDEFEHVVTMKSCQHWWAGEGPSPVPAPQQSMLGQREAWRRWSAEINSLGKSTRL